MSLIEAFGVGIGVGIVHVFALFMVVVMTRSSDNSVTLMKERNNLDREKIKMLRAIAGLDDPTVAVRMATEKHLEKIGANKKEIEFLLSCQLPDVENWCETNLDDLRRSN